MPDKNMYKVLEDLKAFFDGHDESDFLLHTDILNWGPVCNSNKRKEIMEEYWNLLKETTEGKTLLFPTFNYDYPRTRVYDVLNDKCQVGVLNEYIRSCNPSRRTHTPIFNFIELPSQTYSSAPTTNPFGESSIWKEFCFRNGRVCFLGAGFDANTFTHHVEDIKNIGYRYLKPMPGNIDFEAKKTQIDFIYRVRPNVAGAVEYDHKRLETDLLKEGIMDYQSLGAGKALSYNSMDMLNFWLARLEDNELYLLTDESRAKINELKRIKPYPFRFEDFEGEEVKK